MAASPLDLEQALAHIAGSTPDERARQIIIAAYALLADEGLDGLTIRAVLNRTGLARRAFYERFATKDDMVLAVFQQTIQLAANFYRETTAALADPFERLHVIVISIAMGSENLGTSDGHQTRINRRGAALSREHLRLADARPHELQVALAPLLALIAEQIRAGIAIGTMRACDADRQATLIYNLVSTTVHAELLAQEAGRAARDRREELAAELWEFCRRAILV